MNEINTTEVEQLARLARVGVSPEEAKALATEMTEILEYARQLDLVETENIEPTSQVTGLYNVYREDCVNHSLVTRDELLSNSPESEEGSIKVKAVL